MPKTSVSSSVGFPLFGIPVPYPAKAPRKTILVVPLRSESGESVITSVCVEDTLKDRIPLAYYEVTLSNLVDKGIDPHALDMIDTQKLGVDAGVDALAGHIINNVDKYVESSKSE